MSARWDREAARFAQENPGVVEELRALALRSVRAGNRRVGIGQLFEVLRWDYSLRTSGGEFKLNNNYRAWMARHLMATTPELADAFETRGDDSTASPDPASTVAGAVDVVSGAGDSPVPVPLIPNVAQAGIAGSMRGQFGAVDDTEDGDDWWEAA
jgi:hypothetical protein